MYPHKVRFIAFGFRLSMLWTLCFLPICVHGDAFAADGLGEGAGQGSGGVLSPKVVRIEGDGCAVGIFKGLLRLKGPAQGFGSNWGQPFSGIQE